MEITKKERLKNYSDRYISNKIDLNEYYSILEQLFNEDKFKKSTLQKGHDLNSTYDDAKKIQANNRNNTTNAISESIEYMNKNTDIVGFTFNNNVNRPWFHKKIVVKDHHNKESNSKYSNRSRWHDLYIK